MAAGDLTNLADVKQWMGVTTANDDALLTRLITAASAFIQTYLNRIIASQAYSEVRNGLGNDRMAFADAPVTQVNSLTIDGIAIPASTGPTVSGYVFSENMLYLRGYSFTRGIQNVAFSYVAGYAVTPPEIAQACIELVNVRYKQKTRPDQTAQSTGGNLTASYSLKDMPDTVRTILDNYKKVVLL